MRWLNFWVFKNKLNKMKTKQKKTFINNKNDKLICKDEMYLIWKWFSFIFFQLYTYYFKKNKEKEKEKQPNCNKEIYL